CRDCQRGARSPLFEVSAGGLIKGYLLTLAAATLGGWLASEIGLGFGLLGILWGGFLYGIGVGEVALRATGRKRGRQMEIMAGVGAGAGIVLGWFLAALSRGGPDIGAVLLMHLRSPWSYVFIGWAVTSAIGRIRNI